MWKGVTKRFSTLNQNLLPTQAQIDEGKIKHKRVRNCLNQHYYGIVSDTQNSFLVGSWAKRTRMRPPRDVDVYFVLPYEVYERFQGVTGNRQSTILQEVRGVLRNSYPSSDIRADGQVVVVNFNSISVEVAPVFLLQGGQYYFCNTHNGGNYDVADPDAEQAHIEAVDNNNNNNLRRIIRMVKCWQTHCNVPIKSYWIELLVAEFIETSPWRRNSYFYYDWLIRDFFAFLVSKQNSYVFSPGTAKSIFLGDAWLSRAQSAYSRALRACEDERADYVYSAGEEWQKIFGTKIPQGV